MERVAGHQVAGAGRGPADRVALRPVDEDAALNAEVRDRGRTGHVRADVVPLQEVAGGRRAQDDDSGSAVSGDHVSGRRGRPANDGGGRVDDEYTVIGIRDGAGRGGVRPNVVAGDQGPRGRRVQLDSVLRISGNHVARGGGRAADRVVR